MPYKFFFLINNNISFQCNLRCNNCISTNTNGSRCKLRSCIGTPYCWIHLLYIKHLRIKYSTNPRAGKGLFVMSKQHDDNEIVFRNGDIIIEYGGEIITNNALDNRYGDYTAPYAIRHGNRIEDGACIRGAGTVINHAPTAQANARFSLSRNGQFRIIATKNIRNNREIFCNYGRNYRFNEPTSHRTSS